MKTFPLWSFLTLAACSAAAPLPPADSLVRRDAGRDVEPGDRSVAVDRSITVEKPDSRMAADRVLAAEKSAKVDVTLKADSVPKKPDATTSCGSVQLVFQGKVATVSGTPLGLSSAAYNQPASGKLVYSLCVQDKYAADPLRGEYDHDAGGAFELDVLGAKVTGSTKPVVQVENLDPDTFRFRDGKQPLDPKIRTMALNGQPDASLVLFIAITDGSGAAFSGDALPVTFPMTSIASLPHTFSIKDANGTLLLQLSSLSQL